jgi:hypothetical protein
MATKTPGLQLRSQYHGYWGQYQYDAAGPFNVFAGRTADAGYRNLPNAPGNSFALNPGELAKLEAGDWASTIDTVAPVDGNEFGFWVCIYPGTAVGGDAVWARTDNLPGGDHWAPRFLVGNVLAGDPATPQTGPFRYIPDPGDGSGIALALAEASVLATQGDVWIRPGTYTRPVGSTPLTIPPGVLVRGSGATTLIVAAASGDQGVFVLGAGSQLRDVNITVPASGASITSVAAVLLTSAVAGFASVRDVNITLDVAVAGVMREGIRVVGVGGGAVTFSGVLTAVTVTASGATAGSAGGPTSCFHVVSGSLSGTSLVATSGDHGLRAESFAIVDRFTAVGWFVSGIVKTVAGSLRASNTRLVASGVAVAPVGISITSGTSHQLRGCSIDCLDIALGVGISATTCSDIDIDDCEMNNCATAIEGLTVTRLTARACLGTDVRSFGIRIGVGSIDCHLRGNHFQLVDAGGTTPVGIEVSGTRHEIEGNRIDQGLGSVDPASNGIRVTAAGSSCTVRGNILRVGGGPAISVAGLRTAVVANVVEQLDVPPAPAPVAAIDILATATRCTVGDNIVTAVPLTTVGIQVASTLTTVGDNTVTTAVTAPATPAIRFTAASTGCIGVANVGENSAAGLTVVDLGAGNTVAHNNP